MGKILIEKSGIFTEISGGSQETPQQLLAKILTVDGKGSGLDADLLGGVNYSQYALKKDYYDRNIINTELSKKLNISDYNNEKSTFALKSEVSNSNKPVYVVSDTEPTDKNVFWIKDEDSPAESIGKSIEDLKKYNDSNYNKIETLQNQIQELKKLLNKQGSGTSGSATASIVSQPRPNLLINGDFSFCRTAFNNGNIIESNVNNIYYSEFSTIFSFYNGYRGMDGWNMVFNDWGSNNVINCSIVKNRDDVTDNDVILTPKYLKINSISINKKEKIILYQNLLHLNNILSQQKENNLDLVISGIIKQKDLDFDYNIYLLYNYDYTSKTFTESERVKLDKEYVDNTGKTPIKINYNVFENINLKIKNNSAYYLNLVIEITPKDNTNKFSKTNSNNPICIGNLKLEVIKKNEEKTPTLFSYYNNSYADDDIASSRYWVSFKGKYCSYLCSDNKHRITLFFKNEFYGSGGYYSQGSTLYTTENVTKYSVTLMGNSPFAINDYFLIGTIVSEDTHQYLKKANNWN